MGDIICNISLPVQCGHSFGIDDLYYFPFDCHPAIALKPLIPQLG